MRRHRAKRGGRGGFTLLEVLIGLTISTLIIGAAAAVFSVAAQSWERAGKINRKLQTAQSIGDLIERHLRAAVDPPKTPSPAGGVNVTFSGQDLSTDDETYGHRLTFISSASSKFPRSGPSSDISEITFELDPEGEDGGLTMRVDPTPDEFPEDGGRRVVLSDRVKSFHVTYFDGKQWLDDWLQTTLPIAVQFELGITEDDTPTGQEKPTAQAGSDFGGPKLYTYTRLVAMPKGKRGSTGSQYGASGAGASGASASPGAGF